jgi:tripeptide aminopeptidase
MPTNKAITTVKTYKHSKTKLTTKNPNYPYTVVNRFLRYVQIDTASDPNSNTFPSTQKQLNLQRILYQELLDLGLQEVTLDEFGYVTATLPSNSPKPDLPTIAFLAHVDTSSSVNSENVKPIIHPNYQGQTIRLPANPELIISPETNPELKNMFGHDLITSDGSTLLGADDKCGVAAIMDALNFLVTHPEIPHTTIKVCFNPDEEIGRGMDKLDLNQFQADFAYTLDGPGVGLLEIENFNAAQMKITFFGRNYHPGYAKNRLVNSLKIATEFISSLPKKLAPERSSGRQGYIHPLEIQGNEEQTTITLILRDFSTQGLQNYQQLVRHLALKASAKYPGSQVEITHIDQYQNMLTSLQQHPEVIQRALRAYKKLGIKPKLGYIRGGTDGVHLSNRGLPCPNLSCGQHNIHSKTEWASVQELQTTVDLLVEIAKV